MINALICWYSGLNAGPTGGSADAGAAGAEVGGMGGLQHTRAPDPQLMSYIRQKNQWLWRKNKGKPSDGPADWPKLADDRGATAVQCPVPPAGGLRTTSFPVSALSNSTSLPGEFS